jgi:hypothetical protein
MTDPNGIFEDDADGGLTEFGMRLVETTVEAFKDKVAESHDALVEVFEAYVDQEIVPTIAESVEDAVAEIRKLCLLSVSVLGGQEKTNEFIRRVGELARAGALSSASGEWASAGPNDSASNLATVRGGSGTLRKEDVERAEAAAIFEDVTADMDEDDQSLMMELCGDLEYAGDANKLRREIELVRNQQVPSPLTESYVKAISRTVLKG